MAYIKGTIAQELFDFMKRANEMEVKDRDEAMRGFCQQIEDSIIKAIKTMDVVIPKGSIVVGTPPAGPMTNVTPLLIPRPIE